MALACMSTTYERDDQQLVNLPVLSLIIYANARFAESIGIGPLAPSS